MCPLVSVIVPVYNVELYLSRCVDSILNQTYKNIEIVLVDDGSPDRCPEICDEYRNKYENVMVVHKKNGGLASARNAGMDVASGEYLFFVDSDDWIDNTCIEDLVHIAEQYQVDFVRTRGKYANWPNYENGKVCDFGIERMMVQGVYTHERIKTDLLPICIATKQITFGPIVSAWGNLYKTSILEENHIRFFEDIKYSEYAIFNVRVLFAIDYLYYLNDTQYYNYFFNPTSITKSYRPDRWKSNKIQISRFDELFANENRYDIQNQLWLKRIFLILNALSERNYLKSKKEKAEYCDSICKDSITVETMKHLNLVNVSWKMYIILLLIKYKQGWLLAKI